MISFGERWRCISIILLVALFLFPSILFADYENAIKLYQSKQFENARAAFMEHARSNPGASNAKAAEFYTIKCLFQLKKYDEFNQEVKALKNRAPNHPSLDDLCFLQAYAEQQQKNWNQAIKLFQEFSSKYPESPYNEKIKSHIKTCRNWAEPESPEQQNTSSKDAYYEWMMKVYRGQFYDKYIDKSSNFINLCPDYEKNPEIMFYRMMAFRKEMKWEEARAQANQIIDKYPESEYARNMGGMGGRTEDSAAFEFAEIVTNYHEKNFDTCIGMIEKYLQNYPRNWRIPELYRYYCYALYHSGNREKFFEISNKFLGESLNPGQNDHIKLLQTTLMVKQGQFQEAQSLIELFISSNPDSKLYHLFFDLRLEIFYKQKKYSQLIKEAETSIKKNKEQKEVCAAAMIWMGIANIHKEPKDLNKAAEIFDTILNDHMARSGINSSKLSTAAIWRIWIAEQKHNTGKAREIVRKVKNEMPEGTEKTKIMKRFGNLINEK